MLVLTRKIGEQIVLPGCGVTIDVIESDKNRVRLGIAAPAHVPVHRRELWERICNEREDSARGNGTLKSRACS